MGHVFREIDNGHAAATDLAFDAIPVWKSTLKLLEKHDKHPGVITHINYRFFAPTPEFSEQTHDDPAFCPQALALPASYILLSCAF